MKGTKVKDVEITWLGHASFKFKGSKGIFIDPYVLPEGEEKADIIVMTHEHFDHCAVENAEKIIKDSTVVLTTKGCAAKCGFETRVIGTGESIELQGVKIETVEAYNVDKQFHPRGLGFGVIVEMDGVRIYHAGDTDLIPEMKNLKPDVALLPIGGTYTMNIEEAVEATARIKPEIVIPMHYNYIDGTEAEPEKFRELLSEKDPEIQVTILSP